ncbi:MAG: hypothetical protein AAFV86_19320 [Pseudomonadota bacterium]
MAEGSRGHWSRHPAFIALLSFVLSGVIASLIGYGLALRAEADRAAEADRRLRIAAARDFAELIGERRTRAALVASALRRGAEFWADTDELCHRKRAYDEAYLRWNVRIQSAMLQVRELVDAPDYSRIETVIEERLVVRLLSPADACLTDGYDAAIAGRGGAAAWDGCEGDRLRRQTRICGVAITDAIHALSRATLSEDQAIRRIVDACP